MTKPAVDPLGVYKKKRDFKRTPEPSQDGVEESTGRLQFVVQKHWASRLHYDFRLELEGTMKSWAVPKGPSLDPTDKRMAVQVEDHPMAYNQFEGQIPPKQYGAGKVIIWDKGYWKPVGNAIEGYRKGRLKFELHGHKLRGGWTLVRMHVPSDSKQPPWLLIKERDRHARPSSEFKVVDEMPDSVKSLPDIPLPSQALDANKAMPEKSVAVARLPKVLAPQLATLVEAAPGNLEQWLFELKFDGYRILARVENDKVQLLTRNGHDWASKMPILSAAVQQLPVRSAWLDGEIVAMDEHGIPDFQALQNAFDRSHTHRLVYYLFDAPFLEGQDLRHMPVVERRACVQALVESLGDQRIRFSHAFEAAPNDLIASACKLGFEGVIGKRKTSFYVSERSLDWIKLKCGLRQEFVIGGYTDPKGTRSGIGSLLLGVFKDDGMLTYVGNVGSGFNERALVELKKKLDTLSMDGSPFDNIKKMGNAHWVRPTLVAEVSFAQWTQDNRVRQAVFRGLREDKPASAIVRERPMKKTAHLSSGKTVHATAKAPSSMPSLQVTHADRVVDPSTGITKIEVVRYYTKVAPFMMEHLAKRPVSLVRAPAGLRGELFFQRHQENGDIEGTVQLDPALYENHPPLLEVIRPQGLSAAAQMNVIELHTWNARRDKILRPDRMTFDLDPGEGVSWERVQQAAELVRVLLHELGLAPFLKTSGGKGLHVVVPIKRLHDWDTVKGFSAAVVRHLAKTLPKIFVAKSGPRNRVGKIFADYLRNGFSATTVCAWSARARPGMGISVPLAWNELHQINSSAEWTVRTVDERLRIGNAPWEGYSHASVSINAAMKALQYVPGNKSVSD